MPVALSLSSFGRWGPSLRSISPQARRVALSLSESRVPSSLTTNSREPHRPTPDVQPTLRWLRGLPIQYFIPLPLTSFSEEDDVIRCLNDESGVVLEHGNCVEEDGVQYYEYRVTFAPIGGVQYTWRLYIPAAQIYESSPPICLASIEEALQLLVMRGCDPASPTTTGVVTQDRDCLIVMFRTAAGRIDGRRALGIQDLKRASGEVEVLACLRWTVEPSL